MRENRLSRSMNFKILKVRSRASCGLEILSSLLATAYEVSPSLMTLMLCFEALWWNCGVSSNESRRRQHTRTSP
jgi:hypothetical protein